MRKDGKPKRKLGYYFSILVFLSLILSAVFVAVHIFTAPAVPDGNERPKSEYTLMLVQCILGVVAMLLPGMLDHRLNIKIPNGMVLLYTLFLYGAIYLGEVRSFYYKFSNWDDILHAFSGAMLCALGFSLIVLLNKADRVPVNLSPAFVAIFAFCFAITMGVVWEIYEYTFDGLMGLNMQKFMLEDGTQLVGRMALRDTMQDLMVDATGAGILSILGYISLKYQKGWIEKIMIRARKVKSTRQDSQKPNDAGKAQDTEG